MLWLTSEESVWPSRSVSTSSGHMLWPQVREVCDPAGVDKLPYTQSDKGQQSHEALETLCQPPQPHRGEGLPSLPRVLRDDMSETDRDAKAYVQATQLSEAESQPVLL